MTGLARWLALPAIAGLYLGILREQTGLALLSLSVIVWLLVEWLLFTWRVWIEVPQLKFERSVNGRTEPSGILWAGRSVEVEVRLTSSPVGIGSIVRIRDVVPENMEVVDQENDVTIRSRIHSAVFRYRAKVLGAGQLRLPGFRIVMHDRQGFFKAERFIPWTQNFRVLPAFQQVGDQPSPHGPRPAFPNNCISTSPLAALKNSRHTPHWPCRWAPRSSSIEPTSPTSSCTSLPTQRVIRSASSYQPDTPGPPSSIAPANVRNQSDRSDHGLG